MMTGMAARVALALDRTGELDDCGTIWDPACGAGELAEALRRAGHDVVATDMGDRGRGRARRAFLLADRLPNGCDTIVASPAEDRVAAPFIRHALRIGAVRVAFLLPLTMLHVRGHRDIWDRGPLARLYPFVSQLDAPDRTASAVVHAWFVWHRDHRGPITIPSLLEARAT